MRTWALHMNVATFALLFFSSGSALANSGTILDTEIRILGVHDGTQSPAAMAAELANIKTAWDASNLPSLSGVSIRIANGGQAVFALGLLGDGTLTQQRLNATAVTMNQPSTVQPIRDIHRADIIIAFGDFETGNGPGGIDACGEAGGGNWLGHPNTSFVPNAINQLDLRSSETNFVAAVVFGGPCGSGGKNSAHELGHLMGGNHPGGVKGLYSDSTASIESTGTFLVGTYYMDVIGSAIASSPEFQGACQAVSQIGPPVILDECFTILEYSDGSIFAGANNVLALETTATSVAYYRAGDPGDGLQCSDGIDNDGDGDTDLGDGDCSGLTDNEEYSPPPPPPPSCTGSEQPFSVNGVLTDICNANPQGSLATFYNVAWQHHCPQDVSFYEIWFSQPDGSPYSFLGTTFSRSVDVWVLGADSRVKIRACSLTTGVCSNLSQTTSSFVAVPQC